MEVISSASSLISDASVRDEANFSNVDILGSKANLKNPPE